MKTFLVKKKNIKRTRYIVDAKRKVLGRFSAKIVRFLQGKHKVEYTPYLDTGDYIFVINAEKIFVTGNKYNNKVYYRHSGYVGGIKKITFKDRILKNPIKIIQCAVKGMLPKGPLGRAMYSKMKVFVGNKYVFKNAKYLNF